MAPMQGGGLPCASDALATAQVQTGSFLCRAPCIAGQRTRHSEARPQKPAEPRRYGEPWGCRYGEATACCLPCKLLPPMLPPRIGVMLAQQEAAAAAAAAAMRLHVGWPCAAAAVAEATGRAADG